MSPIRDGSGNSIGSIRLGDGTEISEVRTGAGDVLFTLASGIPKTVSNNLLFRYKFEDSQSSSTAVDSSANNNDGTISNATYTSNTPFGDFALSFGGNDNVDVPVLFNQNSFTIMGFVNKDTTNSNQYVLDSEGDRTGIDYERITTNGFGFYMFDGSNYSTVASGVTTTGDWVFLAARWDSSINEMEFFTGGLNSSITSHGTASFSSPRSSTGATGLGADSRGGEDFFVGRQDEMILCDAAIAQSDIEQTRKALS